MPYLHISHGVGDYDQWKQDFDQFSDVRQAAGSKGGDIFRSVTDPSDVVVLLEWDEMEQAHAFAQSDELQQMMKGFGGKGRPKVLVVEETDDPPT